MAEFPTITHVALTVSDLNRSVPWYRALFDAGIDVIKSDFGEQIPDDAVAFNGDRGRRLHNVYPLLYNRCVFDATRQFQNTTDAPPIAAETGGCGPGAAFAASAARSCASER